MSSGGDRSPLSPSTPPQQTEFHTPPGSDMKHARTPPGGGQHSARTPPGGGPKLALTPPSGDLKVSRTPPGEDPKLARTPPGGDPKVSRISPGGDAKVGRTPPRTPPSSGKSQKENVPPAGEVSPGTLHPASLDKPQEPTEKPADDVSASQCEKSDNRGNDGERKSRSEQGPREETAQGGVQAQADSQAGTNPAPDTQRGPNPAPDCSGHAADSSVHFDPAMHVTTSASGQDGHCPSETRHPGQQTHHVTYDGGHKEHLPVRTDSRERMSVQPGKCSEPQQEKTGDKQEHSRHQREFAGDQQDRPGQHRERAGAQQDRPNQQNDAVFEVRETTGSQGARPDKHTDLVSKQQEHHAEKARHARAAPTAESDETARATLSAVLKRKTQPPPSSADHFRPPQGLAPSPGGPSTSSSDQSPIVALPSPQGPPHALGGPSASSADPNAASAPPPPPPVRPLAYEEELCRWSERHYTRVPPPRPPPPPERVPTQPVWASYVPECYPTNLTKVGRPGGRLSHRDLYLHNDLDSLHERLVFQELFHPDNDHQLDAPYHLQQEYWERCINRLINCAVTFVRYASGSHHKTRRMATSVLTRMTERMHELEEARLREVLAELSPEDRELEGLLELLLACQDPACVVCIPSAALLFHWMCRAHVLSARPRKWKSLKPSLTLLTEAMTVRMASVCQEVRKHVIPAIRALLHVQDSHRRQEYARAVFDSRCVTRLWYVLLELCPKCHAATLHALRDVIVLLAAVDMTRLADSYWDDHVLVSWALFHVHYPLPATDVDDLAADVIDILALMRDTSLMLHDTNLSVRLVYRLVTACEVEPVRRGFRWCEDMDLYTLLARACAGHPDTAKHLLDTIFSHLANTSFTTATRMDAAFFVYRLTKFENGQTLVLARWADLRGAILRERASIGVQSCLLAALYPIFASIHRQDQAGVQLMMVAVVLRDWGGHHVQFALLVTMITQRHVRPQDELCKEALSQAVRTLLDPANARSAPSLFSALRLVNCILAQDHSLIVPHLCPRLCDRLIYLALASRDYQMEWRAGSILYSLLLFYITADGVPPWFMVRVRTTLLRVVERFLRSEGEYTLNLGLAMLFYIIVCFVGRLAGLNQVLVDRLEQPLLLLGQRKAVRRLLPQYSAANRMLATYFPSLRTRDPEDRELLPVDHACLCTVPRREEEARLELSRRTIITVHGMSGKEAKRQERELRRHMLHALANYARTGSLHDKIRTANLRTRRPWLQLMPRQVELWWSCKNLRNRQLELPGLHLMCGLGFRVLCMDCLVPSMETKIDKVVEGSLKVKAMFREVLAERGCGLLTCFSRSRQHVQVVLDAALHIVKQKRDLCISLDSSHRLDDQPDGERGRAPPAGRRATKDGGEAEDGGGRVTNQGRRPGEAGSANSAGQSGSKAERGRANLEAAQAGKGGKPGFAGETGVHGGSASVAKADRAKGREVVQKARKVENERATTTPRPRKPGSLSRPADKHPEGADAGSQGRVSGRRDKRPSESTCVQDVVGLPSKKIFLETNLDDQLVQTTSAINTSDVTRAEICRRQDSARMTSEAAGMTSQEWKETAGMTSVGPETTTGDARRLKAEAENIVKEGNSQLADAGVRATLSDTRAARPEAEFDQGTLGTRTRAAADDNVAADREGPGEPAAGGPKDESGKAATATKKKHGLLSVFLSPIRSKKPDGSKSLHGRRARNSDSPSPVAARAQPEAAGQSEAKDRRSKKKHKFLGLLTQDRLTDGTDGQKKKRKKQQQLGDKADKKE